jgi:hypothetical protein
MLAQQVQGTIHSVAGSPLLIQSHPAEIPKIVQVEPEIQEAAPNRDMA